MNLLNIELSNHKWEIYLIYLQNHDSSLNYYTFILEVDTIINKFCPLTYTKTDTKTSY